MKVKKLSIALAFGLIAILAPSAAWSATLYMMFDGDAGASFSFPSITVTHPTAGLGDFTGSSLGLTTAAQETYVENQILALVQADYADYDIMFVTTEPIVGPFEVWGIDDTAYTFSDNCAPGVECDRLFGKAEPVSGYARTWAGSFSLDGVTNPYGGTATSSPEMDFPAYTLDEIAQGLANSAAHEIAHLYGVVHEGLDAGLPSVPGSLMQTDVEGVMATTDKVFSSAAHAQLCSTLGEAIGSGACGPVGAVPEPGAVMLFGLGALLMGAYTSRRRK
jgi:hypothetical protein